MKDIYGYHIPMSNKTKATRKAVKRAFKTLKDNGWYAKRNALCCGSCAWSDVPKEYKDGNVVFYHEQDEDSFKIYGTVYLQWQGDALQILKALFDENLHIMWNGTEHNTILVSGIEPDQYKDERVVYNAETGLYDKLI